MDFIYRFKNKEHKHIQFYSYQTLLYIGLIFLSIQQFSFLGIVNNYITHENYLNINLLNFLYNLGTIGLPLILIAKITEFFKDGKKIRYNIIFNAIGTFLFAFIETIGIMLIISITYSRLNIPLDYIQNKHLFENILTLLSKFVNANVFVDLLIFSLLFLFLFHYPKKHLKLFRSLVLFPLLYIIISFILMILYKLSIIELNFYLASFLPSKKILLHFLVLSYLFYLKIYNKNRESKVLESHKVSIFLTLIIIIICLIDFIFSFFPNLKTFGLGSSYYIFISIPFILMFDYKKPIKFKWVKYTYPCYNLINYTILISKYMYLLLIVTDLIGPLIEAFRNYNL